MYLEDIKENDGSTSSAAAVPAEEQKPTQNQLMIRSDSECLSSIINNPGKQTKDGDEYGQMQFDFSSYGGGDGGGVSLTLGLHQHGGSGGVSLAFSPAARGSVFDAAMEDCETVGYSLLDSENRNLPYRNLMGAQLLRDLAG